MKQVVWFRGALLALLIVAGAACKKSSETAGPVNVGGYLESGSWRVSLFVDNGQDASTDFSGYHFTFGQAGVLTATNSTNNATGYWGSGLDDGVSKLTLFFQSPLNFQRLNDDWNVRNASVSRIELADTSSGGGADQLVLERE